MGWDCYSSSLWFGGGLILENLNKGQTVCVEGAKRGRDSSSICICVSAVASEGVVDWVGFIMTFISIEMIAGKPCSASLNETSL